jgi:putative heme-binding domain-containing protein
VPGSAAVAWNDNKLAFPRGTVLTRTFRLGGRAVETQLLYHDGRRWNGYTYRWNGDQTDAELVPAGGEAMAVSVADSAAPGGKREQVWQYPSRAQCTTCHNSFADFTLAYHPVQLDRPAGATNQLDRLRSLNLYPATAPKPAAALVDPHSESAELDRRAKSYLHVNCSHCHRFGGGGSALIDLRFDLPEKDRHVVGQRPNLGTFEIDDARIVAPGDPSRSVMLYRMSKTGRGRMPHIGSQVVDRRGVLLIEQWVRKMPRATAAADEALTLQSTRGALELAMKVERGELGGAEKERVVKEAVASPREAVRDLFERFAPPGTIAQRLGPVVDAAKLLALKGDAARGRQVFYGANGVAAEAGGLCSQCHRVGNDGESFGPELTHIGTKYDRRLLLENILEPSKTIDPQFVTYVCRTTKGQDYSGILVEKTPQRVVLRDAQKHEAAIPAGEVQRLVPQTLSAMPESLLSGLTPQQAADLLEFLAAQK